MALLPGTSYSIRVIRAATVRERLFRGDRRLPRAQALTRGVDLDAPRLAAFAAHDHQRQAVERLAVVGLEGLHRGSVAVVHAGDFAGAVERESHQIVGRGAEDAALLLSPHGDV